MAKEGETIRERVDQYRRIIEISGYRLRKGLETALYKVKEGYTAVHHLPSIYLPSRADKSFIGKVVKGEGKTDDEACEDLIKKLIDKYESLRITDPKNLSSQSEIEKQYLESILVREGE
ncbi:hypothetical protein KY342_03905 [Candidatus Woesearchaeota archaeon]|nr:hypothetical protein [Candidatus Woesearchaeota archaeon]